MERKIGATTRGTVGDLNYLAVSYLKKKTFKNSSSLSLTHPSQTVL